MSILYRKLYEENVQKAPLLKTVGSKKSTFSDTKKEPVHQPLPEAAAEQALFLIAE